jgi:hypothetical protein
MNHNLDEILLAMLGSEKLVITWWNSPNYTFGLDTPNQWFYGTPEQRDAVVSYIMAAQHRI